MSRTTLAGRAVFAALLASALLERDATAAQGPPAAQPTGVTGTARLSLAGHRFALARAVANAASQLADERCQTLLDEFGDAEGRPLRSVLVGLGLSVADYAKQVFFYDAPECACRGANLAITKPGSRAIFVCGARFQKEMARNSRNAEAIVIHELAHSLGLGENPPTSDHITARVRAHCGQSLRVPQAVITGSSR
jgi:hypothetical protein